ncbi:MAG: DUF6493 family protein, partial [Rhodobacter sp.]|nr:DUF6493 family protein [Rhodobacter sp.]
MTETEFLALITQDSAARVLEVLAEIPENERRAFARTAHATLKSYHKAKWDRQTGGTSEPGQIAKDGDALDIAVLATGVPSEIAAHRWPVLPNTIKITEVFQALKPSWIDRWAEAAVEDNPQMLRTVQQLYRQGLCRLPDTDAYILGYYADRQSADWRAGDEFQQRDVWRFFEVEGGGEFCLASHDKYTVEVNSWSTTLLALCAKDALDRGRLLDATLDTLERDFGQFQAGWYSRFHMRLEPTLKEMTARVGRYLNLLGSMVPPTVSLALKILKQVDKTGAILPDDLLASVGPALQARQKSSALAALLLLKSCAKRHKERAADIARTAALALISEAGEVQERALDLIDQLGQSQNPDLRAVFAEYVDAVTPVVRERLSDLLGTQSANVGETPAYPVPQFKAIIPVGSAEEAVSTFLELLENCRDPFLIERAMDGVARFGAA